MRDEKKNMVQISFYIKYLDTFKQLFSLAQMAAANGVHFNVLFFLSKKNAMKITEKISYIWKS